MTKLTQEQVDFIKSFWEDKLPEIIHGTTVTDSDLLRIWLKKKIDEVKRIPAIFPEVLKTKKELLNQLKTIQTRIN